MTGFRASRGALALLSLAFLAAGASPRALAQGGPLDLIHPNETAPTPSSQAPAAPPPGPAAGTSSTTTPVAPKDIEVNRLSGIDPDALGTLDPGQGGLGGEMWRGAPRAEVARLIPAIPAAIPSPALRALARRLLLSSAAPPDGPKGDGPSLVSLRAQKLAEMGDTADLRTLSDVIPRSINDETLARVNVEARLMENDTAGACAQISQQIHQYEGLFWQKAQIFCQALNHETQQVDIGVSLLHDEGDNDPAYFTLVEALTGAKGNKGKKLESLAAATPLLLAMARAAQAPLPPDVLRSPSPAVVRAVAASPNASAELRLAAAERAASLGALAPEALIEIYDQAQVSDTEVKDALAKARAEYGPRARVLLYRAAKAASAPSARATVIAAALSLARPAGAYGLAVAVNLPLIGSLTPAPELASFAREAGRALYYAGGADAAQSWLMMAEQQASASADAADAAVALWAFARLSKPSSASWDDNRFLAWRATQRAHGEADAQLADVRAARLLGLFAALGETMPASAWQALYAGGGGEPAAMPSEGLWHGLAAAASGGRGETVLLALVAIGASAPEGANPIAADQAINALLRVGLEREARQLAIEAAVASGL